MPGNLEELKTLRDCGVVGLKAFMCNSGIRDFPHVDDATLREDEDPLEPGDLDLGLAPPRERTEE